jgi:hypothetical protein
MQSVNDSRLSRALRRKSRNDFARKSGDKPLLRHCRTIWKSEVDS